MKNIAHESRSSHGTAGSPAGVPTTGTPRSLRIPDRVAWVLAEVRPKVRCPMVTADKLEAKQCGAFAGPG